MSKRGVLIWRRVLKRGGAYQVSAVIGKISSLTDNTHAATLQAHGNRINWNGKETILLYWFLCSWSLKNCKWSDKSETGFSGIPTNHNITLTLGGGSNLFQGVHVWNHGLRGEVLIQGRALSRVWVLIWGNIVQEFFCSC